MKSEPYSGEMMDFVYIDEVQDLTMSQMTLFKYICKNVEEGFVFAGDTAQTIARGIDFRFQEVKSNFYTEFICSPLKDREKGKKFKTFELTQNFRTHAGVLHLAQSVIDILYLLFPESIDKLSKETSMIYGESPILLESGDDEASVLSIFGGHSSSGTNFQGFGASQVILVRDEGARKEVTNLIGRNALVLTVLECKGLEFQDVLLYNFFGSSPLKKNWRTVYFYMKKAGLLESTSSAPLFDAVKHNILCSELKQLYVAITRTRQRLWICDSTEDFCEPMYEYWKKKSLVHVRKLDDSLARAMQVHSTPEEWKSQGLKLLEEGNFEMAALCFERAGYQHGEKLAEAFSFKASADRMQRSNPENAAVARRQAARIFEEIGMVSDAAECYFQLKEFERAGNLFLQCGHSASAGECFLLGGCFHAAAKVYFNTNKFSKCLSTCVKGKLFDLGLDYIKLLKKQTGDMMNSEWEKSEQEFLESSANHYHKQNDKVTFMKYVRAFQSLDKIRDFLKSLKCSDELMAVEEERGNFIEASQIARMKGYFLREVDLLEKANQFREASLLLLQFVLSSSLWAFANEGWPLKEFPERQNILGRARQDAKNVSRDFYDLICSESEALSCSILPLSTLQRQLLLCQKHKSVKGEILLLRKIMDFQLSAHESKYTWDEDLHSDHSQLSCDSLVNVWNLWKSKIVCSLQHYANSEMVNVDEKSDEFLREYFGLRESFNKSLYVMINPEAAWLNSMDRESWSNFTKSKSLDIHQFATTASAYWYRELHGVGLKVLHKLQELHGLSMKKNNLSSLCQSKPLAHIFAIAKSLLPFMVKDKQMQQFFNLATNHFVGCVYPEDWKIALDHNMIKFRKSQLCNDLLLEILHTTPKYHSFKIYGQITRILLGAVKPASDLNLRNEGGIWVTLIQHLAGKLKGGSVPHLLCDALNAAFINHQNHQIDITPGCFLHILEQLLIQVSLAKPHMFVSKSSCAEWLLHQDSDGPLLNSVSYQRSESWNYPIPNILHTVAGFINWLLDDLPSLHKWIDRTSRGDNHSVRSLVKLRLTMVYCILYLNFEMCYEQIFNWMPRHRNVYNYLPQPLRDAINVISSRIRRRGDYADNVQILAQGFMSFGDPLVCVHLEGNRPMFYLQNRMLFLDMTRNQDPSQLLDNLYPAPVTILREPQQNAVHSSTLLSSPKSSDVHNPPAVEASADNQKTISTPPEEHLVPMADPVQFISEVSCETAELGKIDETQPKINSTSPSEPDETSYSTLKKMEVVDYIEEIRSMKEKLDDDKSSDNYKEAESLFEELWNLNHSLNDQCESVSGEDVNLLVDRITAFRRVMFGREGKDESLCTEEEDDCTKSSGAADAVRAPKKKKKTGKKKKKRNNR